MAKPSRYNVYVPDRDDSLVIFNTRTGALVRLDNHRSHQLQSCDAISTELLQFLLEQGFLVADGTDELTLVAASNAHARNNDTFLSATIELTEACNFRCPYCYQSHRPSHLANHAFQRVLRYLTNQMRTLRHLHVNWFGGEPLIRFAFLKVLSEQIAAAAAQADCRFTQYLTTNGYLMTANRASELAALGISNVQITVDGDQESHDRVRFLASGRGTYRRVLEACHHVVAAKMELLLRINVSKWSAPRVARLLDDLVEYGITPTNTVIHATRLVDHGTCDGGMSSAVFDPQEFAYAWIEILKAVTARGFNLPSLAPIAYNCPFDLRQAVMIGADGTLRHCSSSDGRLAEISDIGEETNLTSLYHLVKDRNPLEDKQCRDCICLPLCMGGCSYLQEIGQEKCIPERYVLKQLVALAAAQAAGQRDGGL
jgi:uncharacterized protein